jgi:hypothetical protein
MPANAKPDASTASTTTDAALSTAASTAIDMGARSSSTGGPSSGCPDTSEALTVGSSRESDVLVSLAVGDVVDGVVPEEEVTDVAVVEEGGTVEVV